MSMYSVTENESNKIYIELLRETSFLPNSSSMPRFCPVGCNSASWLVCQGGCTKNRTWRLAWAINMTPVQPYFRLLTASSSSWSARLFLELLIGLKELLKLLTLMSSVLRVRFHTTLAMLAQKVLNASRDLSSTRVPWPSSWLPSRKRPWRLKNPSNLFSGTSMEATPLILKVKKWMKKKCTKVQFIYLVGCWVSVLFIQIDKLYLL